MSSSEVDFVPLSSPSSPCSIDQLGGAAPVVAFGAPAYRELMPAAWELARPMFSHSPADWLVVPVGEFGKLLWLECPVEVAGLAAEARWDAIIFAERKRLLNPSPDSPFDLSQDRLFRPGMLAQGHPEVPAKYFAVVGSEVETSKFDPVLPELVARTRPLSREQSQLLDALGDTVAGQALSAGICQILGDQDLCHQFAQRIEGQGRPRHGDYWHAILHRREPDYSNAKYWFRSVGAHPIQRRLGEFAQTLLKSCDHRDASAWLRRFQSGWDAMAFVDLCRECAGDEETSLGGVARQIQWAEMLLLLQANSSK